MAAAASVASEKTDDIQSDENDSASWSKAATSYAGYIEQLTIQACEQLIPVVDSILPLSSPSASAIDVGCGSGSMATLLHAVAPLLPILSTDISEEMVKITAAKGISNNQAKTCNALNLEALGVDGQDNRFSHVFSTFMIQFADDPHLAVREMHRVLRPHGVLGLGTWGKHEWFQLCGRAGKQLDSSWDVPPPYETTWPDNEEPVRTVLEEIGLVNTKAWKVKVPMDIEEAVQYTFTGSNPAIERMLRAWREKGRLHEFRDAVLRTIREEGIKYIHLEAVLAVGQKK